MTGLERVVPCGNGLVTGDFSMTSCEFKRWVLFFILSVFVAPSYADRGRCQFFFKVQQKPREWSEIDKLVFMTFNVANIFQLGGKYVRTSGTDFRLVPSQPPRPKTDEQVNELIKTIDEVQPDFAVLTEVEGLQALQDLSHKLKSSYESYLVRGNDFRNIDIGLIVRADLNVHVETQSHKGHIWKDPVTRRKSFLFSRDLPVYLLRRQGEQKPFLIVVGMHAISQRGSLEDLKFNRMRQAQFEAAVQIILGNQRKFGKDVPIMIAGDFNTNVQFAPEMQAMRDISLSAFDMALNTIPPAARVTHTFHEAIEPSDVKKTEKSEDWFFKDVENVKDEEFVLNHMSQLDDIRFIGLRDSIVLSARVQRYTDDSGKVLPFAIRKEERREQTSDHLPVVVEVSAEAFR